MTHKVKLAEQAEREAEASYEWIKESAPSNAVHWFNGLVNAIESLSSMPERCPLAPESEEVGQEIRQLLYGKYRIIFIIKNEEVFVLHIRHGAQEYLSKENF